MSCRQFQTYIIEKKENQRLTQESSSDDGEIKIYSDRSVIPTLFLSYYITYIAARPDKASLTYRGSTFYLYNTHTVILTHCLMAELRERNILQCFLREV